jgi:hypothetical protein
VVGLGVAQKADECVIMPNHCNAIIMITDRAVGADLCVGPVPPGAYSPGGRTRSCAPTTQFDSPTGYRIICDHSRKKCVH